MKMPMRKEASGDSTFFSLKRRKSTEEHDSAQEQRRRITIACVRCRHRKIRCDGSDPCTKCNAAGIACEYFAVTKEENQAAREKKAIAKASRAKTLRFPTSFGISQDKSKQYRKKPTKPRGLAIETAPLHERGLHTQHIQSPLSSHDGNVRRLPSPRPQSVHSSIDYTNSEHDEGNSMSGTPSAYFGSLSSSTTSLSSSIYEPAHGYNEPAAYATNPDIFVNQQPRPHLSNHLSYPSLQHLQNSYAPMVEQSGHTTSFSSRPYNDHYHWNGHTPLQAPPDAPSGLCLYLADEKPSYSPSLSQCTPPLSNSFLGHVSAPKPPYTALGAPVYQGPIDWSSRPLGPYSPSSGSVPSQRIEHDLNGGLGYYSQTVRLDQIYTVNGASAS